jgi:hypothetical protein
MLTIPKILRVTAPTTHRVTDNRAMKRDSR